LVDREKIEEKKLKEKITLLYNGLVFDKIKRNKYINLKNRQNYTKIIYLIY
jgi:hypothetical protein